MFDRDKKRDEEKRQRDEFVLDSIAKRKQYVKDSIDSVKKTPEHIAQMDSIKLELQKEEEKIIVLVLHGDSTYHYMTQCFDIGDMGKIRLMSLRQANKFGFHKCDVCHYDDEEYVYQDDVLEYVWCHYDKSEIIDMFDIDKYDFEE